MDTLIKKPIISPLLKEETLVEQEKQVIIHCTYKNKENFETLLRIWPSTYLMHEKKVVSSLLFAENITMFPHWTAVPPFCAYTFSLIFSGLPKACSVFDLVEVIPQPGGFVYEHIERNERDVYHIVF